MPRRRLIKLNTEFKRHWLVVSIGILACLVTYALSVNLLDGWKEAAENLLAWGGLPMFFAFSTLYNVLLVPFPYDPFMVAAAMLFPTAGLMKIGFLATLGLSLAAVIDWFLGRWLSHHIHHWLARMSGYERCKRALQVHGVWAVGAAAVTPIPYSLVCWLAGLVGVSLWAYIPIVVLTQGLRCAAILWLYAHGSELFSPDWMF